MTRLSFRWTTSLRRNLLLNFEDTSIIIIIVIAKLIIIKSLLSIRCLILLFLHFIIYFLILY